MLTVDNFGTSGVANVILTSAYDAANNRTSLAATIAGVDDFLSSSTYNALNQLTRLDQTGQSGGNSVAEKRIDFAYNAIGQFTSIARYKDTAGGSTHEIATSTYSYDLLNRLTGLVYKEGATNLFTPYAWSFDNLSRITQQVSEDGTSDYAYDSTSQLTTADHDYQADEAYSYDANGNRTMTGYSTGTNNRLLNDGTHTYTYDFEGNRTKKTITATGEATEYEWDHRNRLVRVTHLDSIGDPIQTLDYAYDVLDRRIEKSDTPAVGPAYTERYVYDGEHLALKFGGSTLANRYMHGPVIDQILADEQVSSLSSPGDVLWPLVDNLGTVRDLAEYDSGTGDTVIVNHVSYDAYGGSRAETNAAVDHLFGYTGREWDAEADLQYNRARWYDPAVGRWLSEDPIGFAAGDGNLHGYVENGPTMNQDPTGLQRSNLNYQITQYIITLVREMPDSGAGRTDTTDIVITINVGGASGTVVEGVETNIPGMLMEDVLMGAATNLIREGALKQIMGRLEVLTLSWRQSYEYTVTQLEVSFVAENVQDRAGQTLASRITVPFARRPLGIIPGEFSPTDGQSIASLAAIEALTPHIVSLINRPESIYDRALIQALRAARTAQQSAGSPP